MRLEPITSLDDPRVADYRDVRDAELREGSGLFMVESRLGVRRLVEGSRFRPRSLLLTRSALDAMSDVVGKLDADTPIYLASQALLDRVVGYPMHRGCLAAAERGEPLGRDALLRRCAAGGRRVLVLEDVANPDNVGGAFRNAWAFGADAVFLTPRCADPLYRKAVRVSMGGSLFVPFAAVSDVAALLGDLAAAGFQTLALDTGADAAPLHGVPRGAAGHRVALVLGAEGEGLCEATRSAAGLRARIPMAPGVDSLNLATVAGIALHHFAPDPDPQRGPGGSA